MTLKRVPYDEPQTWYFTFGQAHAHPGGYVVFRDMAGDEAREAMVARFGRQWAFQYDEADWHRDGVSQADRYGLREIADGLPSDDEPTLVRVTLVLCSLCLAGAGGQCHVPGCALWMKAAPDVPIVDHCESFEPVPA